MSKKAESKQNERKISGVKKQMTQSQVLEPHFEVEELASSSSEDENDKSLEREVALSIQYNKLDTSGDLLSIGKSKIPVTKRNKTKMRQSVV